MEGIAILLGGAALGHALALRLRVPPTPVLMLVGVLLARSGILSTDLLEQALVLGVTFLLFATGVELDPARVRAQKYAALRVGLVQFTALGTIGFAAALSLRFDVVSSAYIALALTASSTLVVIRLLQRRRRLFEPAARLVIGVLLLQDILVIAFIPAITRIPEGIGSVFDGLAGVLALCALAWLVKRYATPRVLRLGHDEERLLLMALATLFVFVGLSSFLGLPLVVGAFLAGFSLAQFPLTGVLRPQLQSIADFFTAIFFTALGALVAPGTNELLRAAALALVVIVATPPLVAAISERYGFSTRSALEAGLLLAQTSEISLVVGLYGMLAGQIAPAVFSVIALVTMITMMLTPLLATDRLVWWLVHRYPARRTDPSRLPAGGHVLLLGSGTTGMPLLETLLGAGHDVMVVDDDPAVIGRLSAADVPFIQGDASDAKVLHEARADRARVISSTIRRPEDNSILLSFARGVPVIVRVFDEEDAEWVRREGGIPVLYSEAAADGLLKWYDRERDRLIGSA